MRFVQTLQNIWKVEELRKRIMVTLLLVLVYRLGCYVVLPGISPSDIDALANFTNKSGLMQLLDMFSGGAFSQASIFALGIMPYITASIVIQLCCLHSRRCSAKARAAARNSTSTRAT